MKTQYWRGLVHLFFLLLLGGGLLAQSPKSDQNVSNPALIVVQPNLPPQSVRTMGEWEEVEGLVIAWRSYEEILTEIVRYAVDECRVYILSNDPFSDRLDLINAGVPTDNVTFIPVAFNSVWIRDYGPWTVYLNKVEERGISDYLYNRPTRVLDDQIPYEVADFIGSPLYNADEDPYEWRHSGGNFLHDGMGFAYSSDLVLRENSGKTGQEIADYAKVFFGVDDYRILSRLNYDTIHHLDMHMRILDEETIAIGEYPPGVADGPVIERNLAFIRNHYRTAFGKPYRILRLPMPPEGGQYPPFGDYRTYTNSIFINKTILVPVYEADTDELALQLYRDNFPGYRVEGINCNEMIDELGALHCISKLVGVEEPLWIAHPRLRNTYQQEGAYMVEAWPYHKTGVASVTLHYRLSGSGVYTSLPMSPDLEDTNRWLAELPAQPAGTVIQYYIEALANDGKRQFRPLPAPEAYYDFEVKDWQSSPTAAWVQTNREVAPGSAILFTNDSREGYTNISWQFPGGDPMTSSNDNVMVHYDEPGEYTVQLITANPLGIDTLTRIAAVRVRDSYLPFSSSFTENESSNWEIISPDSNNVQWQWREQSACQGGCLEVRHREAAQKLNREFLRTAVDLRDYALAALQFEVAYAQRNPLHFDELRVHVIDNNGKRTNIYNKGGDVLATVAGALPDFEPSSCEDWRTEYVSLQAWEGQQIVLEIESIGDRGNSIYLDEINVLANALPTVAISYPADSTYYGGEGGPISETMRVSATDSDGEITQVDFFLDSDWLGSSTDYPYEMPFTLPGWGEYFLQARATDNDGAQVWTESVRLLYDVDNGLQRLQGLPITVILSPNPVDHVANLMIESEQAYNGLEMSIIDASGQLIRQWRTDLGIGRSNRSFSATNLPSGTYWLKMVYLDKQLSFRWVKI